MFKTKFYTLLAFITASVGFGLEQSDERFLPFELYLTEAYQPVGFDYTIDAGTKFVLIRREGDSLVAEFSRKGVFKVPIDSTDAALQVELIKKGDTSVIVPRMALFLANRIISGETNWTHPYRSKEVNVMNRWFLLYGQANEASTREAIELADHYYRQLSEDERAVTAFVYMDVAGDKKGIQLIADELEPAIQAMPGYLSRGYSRSFSHLNEDEELPVLVELQSSGTVIDKRIGVAAISDYLKAR
jgi:hypothetical protein